MKSLLYTRVSTSSQADYSLTFQYQLCLNYINENGILLSESFSEIGSAYNGNQKILNSLLTNNSNCNLYIWNISRFSRNISKGVEMIGLAKKNKINIHFIEDNLDSSKISHLHQIRVKISEAQLESETLSSRLNSRNSQLRAEGWTFGKPVFGKKIVKQSGKRKFSKCDDEKKVIDFIVQARNGISCRLLNKKLKLIDSKAPAINFYDKDGETKINYFNESETLTFSEIADLLNDYNIKKRGKIWSASSVNNVYKKSTTIEYQMENLLV